MIEVIKNINMKQLWVLILHNMFMCICESIDTAFGNNFDLDSLCVLSSYVIITWVTYDIYSIGSNSYEILFCKAKTCLFTSVIFALLIAVVLFPLSDIIPYAFSLTKSQYVLFSSCLKVHFVSLVFLAIGEFLSNYLMLKCKHKLLFISNILFYVLMISLDILVAYWKLDLAYLIKTTLISYLVYDFFLIIFSGILSEEAIILKDIKIVVKHGFNIVLYNTFDKIAIILSNMLASRLGADLYAIHSVSYTLAGYTEYLTDSLFTFTDIKLSSVDSSKKFHECINIWKTSLLITVCLSYTFAYVMLIFLHGDVPISESLFFVGLYCVQVFTLTFCECLRGYLTSEEQSDSLKYAGIVGICVRVPICFASYYFGFDLFGFGLSCFIDFGARGIYYYKCSIRLNKLYTKDIEP